MGNGRFRDPSLQAIVEPREHKTTPLHSLMANRVTQILLVSSLYDSFTFEDEGGLSELLFAEYLELNLRYSPRIVRVSTGEEALALLRETRFDLVISMRRVGDMDIAAFSRKAHAIVPNLPVLLLAYNTRELELLESSPLPNVDRTFVWQGDHRLFVAMIKYVEDRLNVEHDIKVAGVQAIILIEDSARFYSAYLPLLYSELVQQTQLLMSDSVNTMQRLIRMRARPKLLLATTYEEGLGLYRKYRKHVLGVIVDVAFPRNGVRDYKAGLDFAQMVKDESPELPVLLQSSDAGNQSKAHDINAGFIHKHSPSLLAEVRDYMRTHLGFGPFIFRLPDGTEVTRAEDLESLASALLWVPEDSLLFHARRHHFSTWLMARTEFDLAYTLRARKASDFRGGAEEIRRHLHDALMARQEESVAGVVAEFPAGTFRGGQMFVRIGTGSLGGKGRGLAFMNAVFSAYRIKRHIPGVKIHVPPTAILATSVFDDFMESAGLTPFVLEQEHSDDEITEAFLAAQFPTDVRDQLRRFLEKVRYPLAVRSSSLLEDASFQPFAGVYKTFMIPNNARNLETRLEELLAAIRLVYASTFYVDARSYLESTPNRLEEEKMAVVIQQLVGRRYGKYHYPNVAGTARSRDFYPVEGIAPEDGVSIVALGLGNQVMDGGKAIRFSPAHPQKLYQFANVEDYLRHSQRSFSALDLEQPGPGTTGGTDVSANLADLGLELAEEHETLHAVGSVYHHENHAIYDGISRPGARLVTMSGILKAQVFPLANVLRFLLKVGEAGFSAPVEMEFAVKLRSSHKDLHEFGFLQIRPLGSSADVREVDIEDLDESQAVAVSRRALGNGHITGVTDVIYVRPDRFERSKSVQIAQEIGQFNLLLKRAGRHCVLIGQGRWGSSDPWLGIPVSWSQISMARCMVETDLKDIRVEPSQGTHFFQNITSLGIGYFTVNFGRDGGVLDYDWLDAQPAENETAHVRHVHFAEPLDIVIDGRRGLGAIMKPGCRVVRRDGSNGVAVSCDVPTGK